MSRLLRTPLLIGTLALTLSSQTALANYSVETVSLPGDYATVSPMININGHVTWPSMDSSGVPSVMYYDGTSTVSLGAGGTPLVIDDNNGVLWANGNGVHYSINGNTTLVGDGSYPDLPSPPNDNGQIAWMSYGPTYEPVTYYWDGNSVHTLGGTTSPPLLNNNGHVVWPGYDGPVIGWFHWDGVNTRLITHLGQTSIVINHIDDLNRVYYALRDADGLYHHFRQAEDGTIEALPFPKEHLTPTYNIHGQALVTEFARLQGKYIVSHWDGNAIHHLVDIPFSSYGTSAINNNGDVAWSLRAADPATGAESTKVYIKNASGTQMVADMPGIQFIFSLNFRDSGMLAWHTYAPGQINQFKIWDGNTLHSLDMPLYMGTQHLNWYGVAYTWMNDNGDIAWLAQDPANGSNEVRLATYTNPNTAPVANAGADLSTYTGNSINLNGLGSSDADGDMLSYSWSIASAPTGSTALLSDASLAAPLFTPDVDGSYSFSLIVNDGTVDSAADSVVLTVTTPQAAAEQTVTEVTDTIVTIDTSVLAAKNNGSTLENKFTNELTPFIDAQDYTGAIDYLDTQLLPKLDGCALRGEADVPGSGFPKDWVTDCDVQLDIYNDLIALRTLFESQI